MADGAAFAASLGAWAETAGEKLDGLARIAIQDLCEGVIDDTPVDTSFLVSMWQPSFEAPEEGELVDAPTAPPSNGEGIAAGKIAMVIPNLRAGMTLYYTNNTAYGPYQEYGTSRMKGRFFVTRNIAKWQGYVDGAAKKMGLG